MNESTQFAAVDELELALRSPDSTPLPRAILELRDDMGGEGKLELKLCGMLRRLTVLRSFDGAETYRFKNVDALYAASREVECSGAVVDALNYLRLYQTLAAHMRSLESSGESWFDARISGEAVDSLLAAVEGSAGFETESASSALVLGKLHALRSRETARDFFSRTAGRDDGGMKALRFDQGARTYFDSAALKNDGETIAARRASLPAPHRHGQTSARGARFGVLLSCERRYLRLHLPYWLSIADYLGALGFTFHVLLVDDRGDGNDIIGDAEDLSRALAKLRGRAPGGSGGVVSFSAVALPDWCEDVTAFAACARFLYAADIAKQCGTPVVSLDIDIRITMDPRPWFDALPIDRIVLYPNRLSLTVDPWRKFRAGVWGLPHDERAFELHRCVEDYLLLGLGESTPWYVDQNALGHLHEQVSKDTDTGDSGWLPLAPLSMSEFPFQGLPIDYLLKELEPNPPTPQDP